MEKNKFASFEDIENITQDANNSGIRFIINNKERVLDNDYHTLIIGEDNKQKENKIINPYLESVINNNESFIINTKNNDLYNKYNSLLKEKEYTIICLDVNNSTECDEINIFELSHTLYINNNIDKAIEVLENVGYYLFYDKSTDNSDPFWVNSAINLFIGTTLYLFEKESLINLDDIIKAVDELTIENLNKESFSYNYLSSIFLAPRETRLSIISVFKQRLSYYFGKNNLCNMLSKSTFSIKDIINKKTALFIIEGVTEKSNNLISLIVNQVYYVCNVYNNSNKTRLIIDRFDELCPFKNIENIINTLNDININLTAFIKNFTSLSHTYTKEDAGVLKLYFKNLIYLYSDDVETLEAIAKLCGSEESLNNLRSLKENEALFIIARTLPFIANI